MNINVQKLTLELRAAGISTHGNCNSNGVVWDDNNNEIQTRPDVAAIIAAHDPDPIVTAISVDSNIIIGDGVDEAIITVQGKKNTLVPLDVLVGSTPSTVNVQLDENGNGSQVFSCETSPTVIVFSYGEISVKVRAL